MLATSCTLTETTSLPFTEAVERMRGELQAEGFGVPDCRWIDERRCDPNRRTHEAVRHRDGGGRNRGR
jgi:hypothetical protein